MAKELTSKQERLFKFIQNYLEKFQVPPSLREIGAQFGIAPGTVQDQVMAIERKGYLKRNEARARGIQLAAAPAQIPIVGRVHAGNLHTAFEDVEGHVPGEPRKGSAHYFALRVRGDSMIGAGIHEGDIAIVRKESVAQAGDIVVAMVDGETTVKYLRQKGRHVFLEPANPRYASIKNVDLQIIGKVVEVRRRYE